MREENKDGNKKEKEKIYKYQMNVNVPGNKKVILFCQTPNKEYLFTLEYVDVCLVPFKTMQKNVKATCYFIYILLTPNHSCSQN